MSLVFNEANHIAGPAIVTYDSTTWYSEDDIIVEISQAEWTPTTSRFGNLGPRVKSLPVGRVSFKPSGQITAALLAKAFPYAFADVGKSIFSAADKALVIQTLGGQVYTFNKAGLIQTPTMIFAADKTAFDGAMSFMVLGKTNTDALTADTFVDITAGAFTDVSFDSTKVITPGFTAAYGATTGLTAMESLDGFRLSCPVSVTELSVNRFGTIGAYLAGIGPAECRFTPAGMTEAVWLTLVNLDGSAARLPGTETGAGTTDLVLTGTGLTVTIAKCGCSASKLAFGTAKERLGEVVFHSRIISTVGVMGFPVTFTVS
jgi:hypothetical protein